MLKNLAKKLTNNLGLKVLGCVICDRSVDRSGQY